VAPGDEKLERPTGDVDGVNRDFDVSLPYQSGTVRLWRNGVLVRAADDDGFEELGGTSLRTREALLPGDTITARYLEA
jgi:hypothetical protein